MSTTQQTFTNLLRAAVEDRGLDFVTDYNFSNCGTFRVMRAGTLDQVLAVSFGFYRDYATFHVIHGGTLDLHYVQAGEMSAALRQITALLPKGKTNNRGLAVANSVAAQIEKIARDVLRFETLETRRRDSLDFRDVAVWSVREALEAAYALGLKAARDETLTVTRADGRVVPTSVPPKE